MPTLPEANGIYQALLFQKAPKARKEPFLLYFGHPIREKKFRKETERCARALLRWGVKPGSAVFLCQAQTPELLYSLFAIWQLGGIAHLIPPNLPPQLLNDHFTAAKGDLLFLSEVYAHRFCGFWDADSSRQTILIPLTQSLPLSQHRLVRSLLPSPSSSLSPPRLLLWKEFLESGKSLCAAETPPISPEAIAAVYYPPFPTASGHSLTHTNICKATKCLSLELPNPNKASRLLSQVRPWQAEALGALLLPFCTDLCLLLEPRSSHSDILSTLMTEKPDYLFCHRSFCQWVNEQGLTCAALSRLCVLHAEAEACEEDDSLP